MASEYEIVPFDELKSEEIKYKNLKLSHSICDTLSSFGSDSLMAMHPIINQFY
jgi:hypothetical protein